MNKRIFVEKKENYQAETRSLKSQLEKNFQCELPGFRALLIYDIFDMNPSIYEQAITNIFSQPISDTVLEQLDMQDSTWIAYETLDGQYDQRADSAMQCIRLLDSQAATVVKCGHVLLMDAIAESLKQDIIQYLVNPVESQMKDLSSFSLNENVAVTLMEVYEDFLTLNPEQLAAFHHRHHCAMSLEDLAFVQTYFIAEERIPTETELKVIDTYWSDHCRHTTFQTALDKITFAPSSLTGKIEESFREYLLDRKRTNREEKPLTLMDLATINGKLKKMFDPAHAIEASDEINACSIHIEVDHDGVSEPWLLMFKNETHNHPTEIEPFGGASTCIGGAIRDPLSGRSYVYQAMRISGCGDVTQPISETLADKLPQAAIALKATQGNSSYGNQIGLPTTYIHEIYHPSYVAKHLECGAVVGAVKQADVVRKTPQPGDCVVLLGGRTGRDGIGGATGSSVAHQETSLKQSAAEVQKGNAPEEHKIQRLFRKPEVTRLIKRCNDFGAGGVCVAIGELADGLRIDLDAVRTKYAGLNATEIAVSESQERMAVVLAKEDVSTFIAAADEENCEAYEVAVVTAKKQLVMLYQGNKVVDLQRSFVDSAGVQGKADVKVAAIKGSNPFSMEHDLSQAAFETLLSDIRFASQKGLSDRFDSTIGGTSVLLPLVGEFQLTPSSASVQKIPVLNGKTTTCSVLSYGFIPEIFEYSPYLGGQYSVLESLAKTVAVGGDFHRAYLSLQEYFGRLEQDPLRWGNVFQALLGAYQAQKGFDVAAIGGKDSMSGTFKDISVVDTLISFACSPQSTETIITQAMKQPGNQLYVMPAARYDDDTIDFAAQTNRFDQIHQLIRNNVIISAMSADRGSLLLALYRMSVGNKRGFSVAGSTRFLTSLASGSLVVESIHDLPAPFIRLGEVTDHQIIINDQAYHTDKLLQAYLQPLEFLYPTMTPTKRMAIPWLPVDRPSTLAPLAMIDEVKVVLPLFTGLNCEYDSARVFTAAEATVETIIFNTQSPQAIEDSIDRLERAILSCHILFFPGGFSSGDEPDGSAKYIVNVLKHPRIAEAIAHHLEKKHLILGICNGFQALVKSGLIPYGKVCDVDEEGITLYNNDIGRHVSTLIRTVVSSNASPWLNNMAVGEVHRLPVSHGEGKLTGNPALIQQCIAQGQVAFQYCDLAGNPSLDITVNPNGSDFAIEGMLAADGLILGKMGHSERVDYGTFASFACEFQPIFENGVAYFRRKIQ